MNKTSIKKYTEFRKNYTFNYIPLETIEDKIYYNGELVEDEEKKYSDSDTFINIGYNFKNSLSRTLSNLYPIRFRFRGKWVNSIEGVLQGIKHKDKKTQNLIFKYSGLDAYHTRGSNTLDFWGETQTLYWQGKPMKRDSEEYQTFLDELYLSAIKNPLYKKCLLSTEDKYLLHHIGRENQSETVLTRFEFEQRLNSLREFIIKNQPR
ncbi:MAG: hypothetical protein E7354_04695 [Clostridiales bacterium]|nr:hypothetical protein [Clostridiales bacterium]